MISINLGKFKVSSFEFLKFSNLNLQEILSKILEKSGTRIMVTPNVDHIVRIWNDPSIGKLYNDAELCINDSYVFALLSRLFLNIQIPTYTGSNITLELLSKNYLVDKRVMIIGAHEHQISNLSKNYVNLRELHHINPSYGFLNNKEEIDSIVINATNYAPDIVFLAVGSPQQEIVAYLMKPYLRNCSILCIGASIDYLTGKERRAPIWLQNIRMEWFYRFLQSPVKRFKRYFISCPKIFYILWKERHKLKKVN
jgi:N-acetylglucosaminyldiphosphoundecaprenol N-acetyl-beta-D-mannosaminyltransferase